jgi:hypothetical protein
MRQCSRLAVVLALLVPLAHACAPPTSSENAAPQLLLSRTAGPEGVGARIVLGDQVRGDYDARAYSWTGGTGYRMRSPSGERDLSLFVGFAGAVDGAVLLRAHATSDTLQPWGHQLSYSESGASEGLLLHTGRAVISLCVAAGEKGRTALLVLPGEDGRDMALRSNTPFKVVPAASRDLPEVLRPFSNTALWLEPIEPTSSFIVHLGFGATPAQAQSEIAALQADAGSDLGADLWAFEAAKRSAALNALQLHTGDAPFDAAFVWAQSSNAVFDTQEFGPGLWAGLPWFRDNWGRDTFIALPGTFLVTGQFGDARAVIEAFAARQSTQAGAEQGRIPNRVAAAKDTLYNTVDGTPWLIRAAWETAQASGDSSDLPALRGLIARYVQGAEAHLDAEGLLRHAEADTWMDARIRGGRGWSPRGDRAIEIQALWHTALVIGADLAQRAGDVAQAQRYSGMAERVRVAVIARFWREGQLADRLLMDDRADFSLRPNAWMAVSVPPMPERFPFLPAEVERAATQRAVQGLLLPWGPMSLAPSDARFHPRHVDDAHHHKDAAYHNGTVWAWTAGPAISAMAKFGQQDAAYRVSRDLARQILEDDAPGHLSELVDALPGAHGQSRPSGTYAQSWSTAEFVRNAVQDYLGFRPRLLDGVLEFRPALPSAWKNVQAQLPFGDGPPLRLSLRRDGEFVRWRFEPRESPVTLRMFSPYAKPGDAPQDLVLHDTPLTVSWRTGTAPSEWPLATVPVAPKGGWPVLKRLNVLEDFIESGALDREPQPSASALQAPLSNSTREPLP